MLYRRDDVITDIFNNYFHNSLFTIVFYGGTKPTAEEARIIDTTTRSTDELGRVENVIFNTGNPTEATTFTPTADGTVTWVKIFRSANHNEKVLTTGNVGVEGSENHVWVQSTTLSTGVENTLINAYIKFKRREV